MAEPTAPGVGIDLRPKGDTIGAAAPTPGASDPRTVGYFRFSGDGRVFQDLTASINWENGAAYATTAYRSYNNRPPAQQPTNDLEALDPPFPANTSSPIFDAEIYTAVGIDQLLIAIPNWEPGQYNVYYASSDVVFNTPGARVCNIVWQQGQATTTALSISQLNHDAVTAGATVTIADEGSGTGTLYIELQDNVDNANIVALWAEKVSITPPPQYSDAGSASMHLAVLGGEYWIYSASGDAQLYLYVNGVEVYEPPGVEPPQISDAANAVLSMAVNGPELYQTPFWQQNPGDGREPWDFPPPPEIVT